MSASETGTGLPAGTTVVAGDGTVQTGWLGLETSYARLLDTTFERAQREGRLVSVVIVGAMDGRRFDALYPYLSKGLARAILIEPIPDRFDLLKTTFEGQENLIFENCAIDAVTGSREMLYVPLDAVAEEGLPEDVIGMSSFYDDRNGIGGIGATAGFFDTIESHRRRIDVRTFPLTDIVKKHGFTAIDILQIDTEGHDFHVLDSLDLDVVEPDTIFMEYYNLPTEEQASLRRLFEARGYIYGSARKDICATKHRFAAQRRSAFGKRLRKLKRSIAKRLFPVKT